MKPIIISSSIIVIFLIGLVSMSSSSSQRKCGVNVKRCYNKDLSSPKNSFLECYQGECACIKSTGIVGKATKQSQCHCSLNLYKSMKTGKYYCMNCNGQSEFYEDKNGNVVCLNLNQYNSLSSKQAQQEKNKQAVMQLYSDTVFPNNYAVMKQPGLPSYFDPNVYGRVTPLGVFTGRGVVEYVFGLTIGVFTVSNAQLIDILAEDNEVYVRYDIEFNHFVIPGLKRNLTSYARFVFNSNAQIIHFDSIVPNSGAALDMFSSNQTADALQICEVHQLNCTTTGNTQYASFDACFGFIMSLPLGSYNRANSNTVTCRSIHAELATIDPNVHCPHIGPTGGMACIDFTYDSFYDQSF